jgi:NADH-quinone oxidoreductase subunit G
VTGTATPRPAQAAAAAPGTASAPAGITITIDGRECPAEPGELIIAAAEREGVFIPRFCYHPRMKPVGMCRMCLVEVIGPRGGSLQPACFVAVADGQQIVTDSDKVRKAQDGVLEFLLVNHPLDCPVCDKGGECPLQDQTLAYGPGETRFVEEKRHWAKPIPISDLVYLDRERCIQCARCTRFADEVAGEPLIDFFGRGDKIEVATFPGQPFASYFSGNTVQICPVGALTATPYRFRSRPWDLEQAETTCTSCALGCRAVIQSSAGRLVRMLGIDSDPVNQGWLCDKGRFGFDAVNSESRLVTPLLRRDGELQPAGWAGALSEAAGAIERARAESGPGAIGIIGGARLTNEDAYVWAKLAKSVIGTDSVDAQLGDGLPAEIVLGLPQATIDDACSARAVLLVGPDLREELPVLFLRLRGAAVDDEVPLVELAPMPTALARYCKASLSYRPGEAAVAARSLVRALAAGGDGAAAGSGATGPGAAGPGAAGAAGSGAAGLPAQDLSHAAQVLGAGAAGDEPTGTGIVVVIGRPSLAESADGVAEAARTLAAAWPGARFLPVLRRANVRGALDMGLAPGMLPGRVTLEDGREWFGADSAWGAVPEALGLDCRGILEAAAAGGITTLVLVGADPLADFPDRDLARRAIDGAGFVIAVDTFLNESTARADVVLPAAGFAERGGTTTNCEGRISRLAQKMVPPGVAWADWMIASEIAARLGSDLGFENFEAVWEEIERLAPSHRGLTGAVLDSPAAIDGVVVPIAAVGVTLGGSGERAGQARGRAPIDPIATPGIESVESQGAPIRSGASQPAGGESEDLDEQAGMPSRPPLVRLAAASGSAAVPQLDKYSLRLVSRHQLYDAGTLVQACESLAPLARASGLAAHPADLDGLGVATGDLVRVRSPRADVEIEVVADASMPRGVVSLGFNLPGDGSGVCATDLIDASMPVVDVRLETI